jgi:hypothetical protein
MVEPNGFEMNLEEPLPAAERMCNLPNEPHCPSALGHGYRCTCRGPGLALVDSFFGRLDCGVGLMVLDVVTTVAPSDDAIGILHVRIAEASGLKAKSMFFTLGMSHGPPEARPSCGLRLGRSAGANLPILTFVKSFVLMLCGCWSVVKTALTAPLIVSPTTIFFSRPVR